MATATLTVGVFPVVRDLVSLTKPRVSLLVILTCAAGMAIAPGSIGLGRILLMMLGMVLVVGSANVLNCYLERESDGLMRRTEQRALPAGRLPPPLALGFGLALATVSLPMLLSVNTATGLLGILALFLYVGVYTPMKSRSPEAMVVGAVPGALPPLMGWTAVTAAVDAGALVLFGILFLWQMPHVIGLSCYRKAEYVRAGIRVLPAVRGDRMAKWHALGWAMLLLPVSAWLVPLGVAGPLYGTAAILLGLAYVAVILRGFRSEAGEPWGRRLFLVSLFYLPLLFMSLMFDALV